MLLGWRQVKCKHQLSPRVGGGATAWTSGQFYSRATLRQREEERSLPAYFSLFSKCNHTPLHPGTLLQDQYFWISSHGSVLQDHFAGFSGFSWKRVNRQPVAVEAEVIWRSGPAVRPESTDVTQGVKKILSDGII